MKESYLVPDYFPKFACKMGECRHPCCKGWPVSISTDDYFRLLSVSCGPAMRERLDNAVRVSLHPTPEAYAQIAPTGRATARCICRTDAPGTRCWARTRCRPSAGSIRADRVEDETSALCE
ncbi:MAG: hypothetical protein ACLUI3_05890 [Christensenellales bacterium]